MKVRDIMSEPVLTCSRETWVAQAARLMASGDCGILPVIDSDGRVHGVITDRDICLAIARSNRSPRAIAVHEVMTHEAATTTPDDDLGVALNVMKGKRVRRLPVIDGDKRLKGLLSLEDIVIRGFETGAVREDDIIRTLRALYERRPVPVRTQMDSPAA